MDIAAHLHALESELLSNATRKNPARLSELLADTFCEFGSSGRVYTKEEIIIALREEKSVSLSLHCFETRLLAENVALVTYRSGSCELDAPSRIALRSSIWIEQNEHWRRAFHQGTKIPG